jgi:hypothetical protein
MNANAERNFDANGFGQFAMPTPVAVTTIGKLTISTVNLNDAAVSSQAFETCVFYPNGDSSVIGRWPTEAEALKNHATIVAHEIKHIVARLDLHVI